jgi:hypothetical protein
MGYSQNFRVKTQQVRKKKKEINNMNVKAYIQQQFANAHHQIDIVMQDLTEEQFNWVPPGTINPISAVLVHILGGEDFFIQAILQGKPRGWDVQGWSGKVGIQAPPGPGHGWEEFKTLRLPIAPVMDYGQAVREATDAYLANLTAEELDRQVNFASRMMPAAEVLMMSVVHTASHAGEIAAVKGMQGIKGLPF